MKRVLVYGMSPFKGGVESFIMNYYRHIDRNKVQFDFLIYDKLPAFHDEITKMGGSITVVTGRRKNFLKNYVELNRFFKTNKDNYDAVWCNLCTLSDINLIKFAKKYNIKKRIIHSHNSMNMGGRLSGFLHNKNKKKIGELATDFWACSRLAGEWFYDEAILNSDKFKVINNAIDASKFKFSKQIRDEKRKELNISDEFVIGHVGRFHFQKNHEFLIDIFEKINKENRNTLLVLIGSGEDLDKIKHKVSVLGLENAVKFLGIRSDIPELMQAMDIFVLPSRFEGLPVVGIEAQATGLPCVFSDFITREVAITSNCVFLNLDEGAKAWENKILEFLNGYERKECMQLYDSKFDIKYSILELEKYFCGKE